MPLASSDLPRIGQDTAGPALSALNLLCCHTITDPRARNLRRPRCRGMELQHTPSRENSFYRRCPASVIFEAISTSPLLWSLVSLCSGFSVVSGNRDNREVILGSVNRVAQHSKGEERTGSRLGAVIDLHDDSMTGVSSATIVTSLQRVHHHLQNPLDLLCKYPWASCHPRKARLWTRDKPQTWKTTQRSQHTIEL